MSDSQKLYRAMHPEEFQLRAKEAIMRESLLRAQPETGKKIRARDREYRLANRESINAATRRRMQDLEYRTHVNKYKREWDANKRKRL